MRSNKDCDGDGDGEKKRSLIVDDRMEALNPSGGKRSGHLTKEMRRYMMLHCSPQDLIRQYNARHGGKRKKRSASLSRIKGKKRSSAGKGKKRSSRDKGKKRSSGDKGNSAALSGGEKKDDSFDCDAKDGLFSHEEFERIKDLWEKTSWDPSAPPYHTHFPATEIPIRRLKKLAAKLVDFYSKREGLDFELVEAVKGFSVTRDGRTWKHMNFTAKLKDSHPSDDVKFFFGELDDDRIPTCCIIDPDDDNSSYTRRCDVCDDSRGEVIFHPIFGTLSMLVPPASTEIRRMYPSIFHSNGYKDRLIKAGGDVEKATKAQRGFIFSAYLTMPGAKPCLYNP